MAILGWICLVVALSWIGYKTVVSYNSYGGTVMVTVYDAVIYPPLIATFGLFWVLRSYQVAWPLWGYGLFLLGVGGAAYGLIRGAEELGDRPQ